MTRVSTQTESIVVRSYELDPYGHVNNGAFINWFEFGREQLLRAADRDYVYYPRECGVNFVVVNIDCDFMASGLAGASYALTTRIARTGTSSVVLRQSLRDDDGAVICRARVVMAFAELGAGSRPIPEDFSQRFEVSPGGDSWTDDEGGAR